MDYLKAEQLGSHKWRVNAIPFGGPLRDGRDLDGEFFSQRTDIKADWFSERPALFQHGQDPAIGDAVIGIEDELRKSPDGWWGLLWLDRSHRYHAQVDAMLRAGKMYGSSGALAHLVRKAADGEILVWPHVEQTLTLTPANPFARILPAKAIETLTTAGIAIGPSLKGLLEADPVQADLERMERENAEALRHLSSGDPLQIAAALEEARFLGVAI